MFARVGVQRTKVVVEPREETKGLEDASFEAAQFYRNKFIEGAKAAWQEARKAGRSSCREAARLSDARESFEQMVEEGKPPQMAYQIALAENFDCKDPDVRKAKLKAADAVVETEEKVVEIEEDPDLEEEEADT